MSREFSIKIFFGIFALTFAIVLLYSMNLCFAASLKSDLRRAKKLYQNKKYDEALELYNKAQDESPDSGIINFNIGASLYKKGDYAKAIDAFTKALSTDNRKLEADSNYNIGNSKYQMGKLKENTDLSGAVDLNREALDFYKRAIELDQSDKDAKYNHEFVEKNLKQLLEKLKKQENKKNNDKQDKNKNETKKKSKQRNSSEEEKGKKKKEEPMESRAKPQKDKGNKKEPLKQKVEQSKKGEKQETSKQEPKQKPRKMGELSKEEAKKLIERYGAEKEILKNAMKRQGKWQEDEVVKDW